MDAVLDHRYARINTDAVRFIVNIILHVRIYARFAMDRPRRSYEAHTRRTARSHRDPRARALRFGYLPIAAN